MRRHGFTPQRPTRRAYEQQPAAVLAWLDEEYPAIEDRAKAEGAAITWVDQCGPRSDAAPPGRPWAPKGRTPIVRVTGKRLRSTSCPRAPHAARCGSPCSPTVSPHRCSPASSTGSNCT
ncbi:winged helix-turn-helix domain-containing protein [Saccharothrix sp. Mg75]|uniref:winged helix-turn-helix domain-containing protein n=1 Tax=Saccharothrix sp. Mg75 TaxID=3445357 RepID=UPI003EE93572